MKKEIKCNVRGRVQGVMFRDFVKRSAKTLGVFGYVKNLPDGSVEILAQGNEESLNKLIEKLHKGSMFSKVQDVEVNWREPQKEHSDFKITY